MGLLTPEQEAFARKRLIAALDHYGWRLGTGFLSTPMILDVLAGLDISYAYRLLENEEMPGWLFMPKNGATTVWEHLDGLKPDGTLWNPRMNSFNHYAYGAVGEWMFNVCAGIQPDPENPGFRRIRFAPQPDPRMGHVSASIRTAQGLVASAWAYEGDKVRYTFTVPAGCTAVAQIGGAAYELSAGVHRF